MSKKNSEDILLEMVIEYFINYGAPIGSKFLFESKEIDIAPSTIRKYLNILEKKWYLYQPYNSAWRLPTVKWIETYIGSIIPKDKQLNVVKINQELNLRWFIEKLSELTDSIVFWYFEDDNNMYYLWLSKILKKLNNDIEKIIPLMEFVESRQLVWYLMKKNIEKWKINSNFINYNWTNISTMYIKIPFHKRDSIIWMIGSLRLDYKTNIAILENILNKWTI